MIAKSLLILAIVFRLLHINSLADRFDNSILKAEQGNKNSALASQQLPLPFISKSPTVSRFADKPEILAQSYLLADLESGTTILKSNPKEKLPIASTTKIMTAIIALENYKLDDVITISGQAAYQAGADSFLTVGEKITVKELLYCLLVKSGNDSAFALAEYANGTYENGVIKFVAMMNQKAKRLGMASTEYRDPAGLDVTGYSTAYDLFLVTKYALNNTTFSRIVSTKEYIAKSADGQIWHKLENSNRLVNEYNYPGAIGVKTGYMPEAGHCLVSAAERDGHTLIGVVLHTSLDTASASADESKKLLDWGFTNVKW